MSSAKNWKAMAHLVLPNEQAAGTVGGTLIAFIGIIDYGDIVKTSILAGVGAVVSYAVSRLMQKWFGKRPPDKR